MCVSRRLAAVVVATAMLLVASAGVLAGQAPPPQTPPPAAPDRLPGVMPVQIPPAAQQYLAAAIDALSGVAVSKLHGEAATGVAAVQRDFQQMRAALSNPGAAGNGDWRTAYAALERDLAPLVGTPGEDTADTPEATGATLDTVTRGSLQLFQTSLELFYRSMAGEPSTTPTAPAPAGEPAQARNLFDVSGAGALLDRIDAIVSAALENKLIPQAGSDSQGGKAKRSPAGAVMVDRAALDEILAEVRQLKVMLRVRE
jgi:hypothetical protein